MKHIEYKNGVISMDSVHDTKNFLQSLTEDSIGDLTVPNLKESIKNATIILLLECGEFGYTIEELEFYMGMRYKLLSESKSKSYITTRIKEVIKEAPYIETIYFNVWGKAQKKFRITK